MGRGTGDGRHVDDTCASRGFEHAATMVGKCGVWGPLLPSDAVGADGQAGWLHGSAVRFGWNASTPCPTAMPMDIGQFLRLKPKQWQFALFFPLGTVVPGSLVVLHFRPDLFVDLGMSKVILLSVAITLPTLMLSLFVALPQALLQGPQNAKADQIIEPSDFYMMAGFFSAITIYAALAVAYFRALPFRGFLAVAMGVSVILGAVTWGRFFSKVR